MRVYNLTASPLEFHGKVLAPNGGSFDFKDMNFVPNRDKQLVTDKVIAIGSLPKWFVAKTKAVKKAEKTMPVVVPSQPVAPPPSKEVKRPQVDKPAKNGFVDLSKE